MNIKVKLFEGAKMPVRSHADDLGFDLFLPKYLVIGPGEIKTVSLGISIQLPPGWGAFLRERSSTAKQGLSVIAGVIDPGYRGELKAILVNHATDESDWNYFNAGDRLVQLIPVPLFFGSLVEAEGELASSVRGAGGFGSTGRN